MKSVGNETEEKNNKSVYNEFKALIEAERCLSCFDPPCRKNCPAAIPIPDFIRSIKSGNTQYAARLIREANPLAAICGEVCPEEIFCQSYCTRNSIDGPVNIRGLHGYATNFEAERPDIIENPDANRVAVIGSGPAGLACAIKLAENCMNAVVYEKTDHPGGVPASSIPNFRLPDKIINLDIEYAKNLGIKFELNRAIDDPRILLNEFDAVFMATGLPINKKANIPGEEIPQVLTALSFLEGVRSGKGESLRSKRLVIIGGGNVSLDVAAAAMNAGASEVHLLYRRGPREMKVWKSELEEAQSRGVIIDFLTSPVEFIARGKKLDGVKCIRTRLAEELDSSGRPIPEPVPGTEFITLADLAVTAIGLSSHYSKDISVNPDLSTSIKGVFAGGDWARGEGTIVEAVRDGKLAAESIMTYVKENKR